MKLEFVRTESEVPALSHGGTSCLITWELKLNGVVISSESNRYFWEVRKESSLEPHWSLQKLHDSIIKGLEQEMAKPVDVAVVRELRKIWCIRDLTTDDFDNAEAMLSTPSAEPERKYKLGDRLTKTKGSKWTGHVVGFYSTDLTPIGYAIESETETGSVQIYPETALTAAPTTEAGR